MVGLRPILPASACEIAVAAGVDEATVRTLIGHLRREAYIISMGRQRDETGRLVTVYEEVA